MSKEGHLDILLVEDNPGDARLLQELLLNAPTRARFTIRHVETLAQAVDCLHQQEFSAILLDLSLSDSLSMDTIAGVRAVAPKTPVVVLTGVDDEKHAMEAVRGGAQDYLVKGQVDGKLIFRSILYSIERKRIEEQLKEVNETLEERVEEKTADATRRASQLGALASQLSQAEQRERRRLARVLHDGLQQLLVAAKMQTSQLRKKRLDDEATEAVNVLDGLLDQSIMASRELTIELSPPILHDMGLVSALEWLGRQMNEKHRLRVEIDADQTAHPETSDLRVLLFESVRELLFNVVKHSDTSYARIQVACHSDCEMKVVVEDYGAGFEVDKTHYTAALDGGFGLFSIRERLELLGGRVDIYSSPGCGTRVSLYSPMGREKAGAGPVTPEAAQPRAEAAPLPDATTTGSRKVRVMVAEDHNIVAEGLILMLQQHRDIEVVGQAADGQAAVELARQLRPDVVLMDFNMPRLNGADATRIITQELADIRVIGLSMHEEADMAAAMRKAGAAAYLTKGGSPDVLVETIRQCHRELGTAHVKQRTPARL